MSVPGFVTDEGVLQCRDTVVGQETGFGGGGVTSGMGREGVPRFELCSLPCRVFKQTKMYVFMFCIICFGGDETHESREPCNG